MKKLWKYFVYAWKIFELQLWYNKHVDIAKGKRKCTLYGPSCHICSPPVQKELAYLEREYNRVRDAHRAWLKN